MCALSSLSAFGYIKYLAVWGLVLLADFILEFRFEYLYPVWLLLRSVQDSYKYQGVVRKFLHSQSFVTIVVYCPLSSLKCLLYSCQLVYS